MAPKRRKQPAKQTSDGQLATHSTAVPAEGSKEESMPPADKPLQGLKFVDVSRRYLQGIQDSVQQKSIRVHVMQDFLRQRKQPIDAVEPPAMAGTVSGHVHHFRIAKPRLPEDKASGTVPSQKVATWSEQSRQSTPPRSSSTTIGGSRDLSGSDMVVLASADQQRQCETLLAEERASASPPRILPNLPGVMARMDPFARLPIDGSIQTHEILDYCEHHVLSLVATSRESI